MIALDERTRNVLNTIAVYAAIGGIAFVARATLVVFVLALLLAYLLDPVVGWVERRLAGMPHARGFAIATVYLVGTVTIAAGAYFIAANLVEETQRIAAALSAAIGRAKGMVPAGHADLVAGAAARAAGVGARAVHDLVWLLAVPIIAIFFLGNRADLIDGIADLVAGAGNGAADRRTLHHVDRTLAEYARGQLILAALSGLFYSLAMALLGFPYPLVLGVVGGAMEFIPALGWVLAATTILVSGAAAHAHWVPMAACLAAWRLMQDFVNSPRVMSERLHLNPLMVLFAIMVGGQLAGVIGALLSMPAVAVARVLWNEQRSRTARVS